ncbi:MAG: hypothetical protein EBQ96_00570 [Proteobacteria bacterium]|nr:hypothetical protein [Pseudomonadota bacterium]
MVLSMPAFAQGQDIERCVEMRLDDSIGPRVGLTLNRMKQRDIDIPNADVTVQPRMAGLKGPNVTFFGRDVRLAVERGQSSPQELWRTARWNHKNYPCAPVRQSWKKSLQRGIHWKGTLDSSFGFTTYQPKVLYRSRFIFKTVYVRPHGFSIGAALEAPVATNTEALLYLPDARAAVRRDMARFSNGGGVENLFLSWRTTPMTDVHLAFTGGWLEQMYGGFGAEVAYRPFGTPFWFGADGWEVWRRDPTSFLNTGWNDTHHFTGHVRIGYDKPESRFGVSVTAGRYLAGDTGATLEAVQGFENGAKISASLAWTNRSEDEGFFTDTHFDPKIRLVWPIGGSGHYESITTAQQMGRDGGQMLDRPMPLEVITEPFSTREIIRDWARMF